MAVELARDFGLHVHEPVPLRSTNNVVVWLSPAQVVAKVGFGRAARLRTELQVALELSERGAPVAAPATKSLLRFIRGTAWT